MDDHMQILVFGPNSAQESPLSALKANDYRLSFLGDIPEAVEMVRQDKFDLVIVDSQVADVQGVCNLFYELHLAPVVLMVKDSEPEWKQLFTLNADAFISYNAGTYELPARIKAVYRRSKSDRQASRI